jgi:hypothetical protein
MRDDIKCDHVFQWKFTMHEYMIGVSRIAWFGAGCREPFPPVEKGKAGLTVLEWPKGRNMKKSA